MILYEVHSNYCKLVGLFYVNFSLYHFLSEFFTLSFFEVKLDANVKWLQHRKNKSHIAQSVVHKVMKREVNGSNPGGVKCFSTRLSFESNSSDISRLMFTIVTQTLKN